MRDWAQTFDAAVRQRSVRQETTMVRAGTLPSYLYQREVRPGESVSLKCSGDQRRNEAKEAGEEDGILEYDSSSSKELDDQLFSTNNDKADDVGQIPSLERFFAWNGFTFRKNCPLQQQNYSLTAANC